MRTYIADIIPKIQRFSQQLDNITLLTNQHWVVIDGIKEGKSVYIFRPNGELIISTNGRVEKAKWELLGKNSILVDMKNDSYLFKHGFFDENVLALKIDGREEYAFLLNENRYSGELNSVEQVVDFLESTYLSSNSKKKANFNDELKVEEPPTRSQPIKIWRNFKFYKGLLEIEVDVKSPYPVPGDRANIQGKPAPDRKYQIGFLWNVTVKNGIVEEVSMF